MSGRAVSRLAGALGAVVLVAASVLVPPFGIGLLLIAAIIVVVAALLNELDA